MSRIITVASDKGGVAKTTTAIHLAAFFQKLGPTLLVDGDGIRSATKWSKRGNGDGLPFKVVSHIEMVNHIRDYENIIIDTEGNPTDDDFRDLAQNCDFLVVPAVPETVATDGLTNTLAKLHGLHNERYRVLLTMVPPPPRIDGKLLREMLVAQNVPTFLTEIPRLSTFDKAAAAGVPVYAVKDDKADRVARAWAAYDLAGKEIVKALAAYEATGKEVVNG